MKNVSDKHGREKSKHILCSITFFPSNRTVYEIMWKNMAEPDRPPIKYIACAFHAG
jgi:hypothetical protein